MPLGGLAGGLRKGDRVALADGGGRAGTVAGPPARAGCTA
eukprot:gene3240-11713_t